MTASAHALDRSAPVVPLPVPPAAPYSLTLTAEELAIFGDGDPVRGKREIKLMIANERDRKPSESTPCPRSRSALVTLAKPEDEQAIVELLMIDVWESAAIVAPPNEDEVRATVKQALGRPNIAGVIRDPAGTIVGVVMLIAMKWWWSKSFYYQEIPLFVHPDHRKSDYAHNLLAFQQWWVDEMTKAFGYRVHLFCGVLGTVRVRAKIAWYRRKFREVGRAYLYPWPFTEES